MEQENQETTAAVEERDAITLLILDLDGTVREPLSDNKFIQRPRNQRIIQGAEGALSYFV